MTKKKRTNQRTIVHKTKHIKQKTSSTCGIYLVALVSSTNKEIQFKNLPLEKADEQTTNNKTFKTNNPQICLFMSESHNVTRQKEQCKMKTLRKI